MKTCFARFLRIERAHLQTDIVESMPLGQNHPVRLRLPPLHGGEFSVLRPSFPSVEGCPEGAGWFCNRLSTIVA